MAAGPANWVGSVTIPANTAVGLFNTTSADGSTTNFIAGTWSLQGVLSEWGLCQVLSATSPSTEVAFALSENEIIPTGSAEVFIYNPTSASVTFNARFASTS